MKKTRLFLSILITFHNKSPSPSAPVSWAISARVLFHLPLWPDALGSDCPNTSMGPGNLYSMNLGLPISEMGIIIVPISRRIK